MLSTKAFQEPNLALTHTISEYQPISKRGNLQLNLQPRYSPPSTLANMCRSLRGKATRRRTLRTGEFQQVKKKKGATA
jgi:hypothetical protein